MSISSRCASRWLTSFVVRKFCPASGQPTAKAASQDALRVGPCHTSVVSEGKRRDPSSIDPRAGLCASCRYAEIIISSRGSTFYLCHLADTDARFAKYPSLPVLECEGYEHGARTGSA
jgi:hypothetical protein